MTKRYTAAILTLVFIITSTQSYTQPVVAFETKVSSGLVEAVDITNAGDGSDRIFVVQRGGTITVYESDFTLIGNFLSIPDSIETTGGEEGLLSLAFDPDYELNGFFYVYYVNPSGNVELARYSVTADPDVADPESGQVVLTIPHLGQRNHNGAKLNFGLDGYLYFATGDGGGAGDVPNNAQNPSVLLGKMLRIDVNQSATAPFYTVPADNPYTITNDPGDAIRDEIWAFGLRNPFRWSFDEDGNMWIGDVGQGSWEELNFRAAGTTGGINYGWRC
jgi:glucose/arabinose dehydrogenase